MHQLQYDYICLRCGRRLIPEGECDDNTAPILFDLSEALDIVNESNNFSRSIPAYFTAEELRGIVSDPESCGEAFMKATLDFERFMNVVAERSCIHRMKNITAEKMAKYFSVTDVGRKSEKSADEFDLDYETAQEDTTEPVVNETAVSDEDNELVNEIEGILREYGATDAVGDFDRSVIENFCQVVRNLFFDSNDNAHPYEFQIKVNLSEMGKPGTKIGYTYKRNGGEEQFPAISVICGERGCWNGRHGGAPVPPMAWQNEHIAIGFIGAAGSGKTCLITSLLLRLLQRGKLVDSDKRGDIEKCVNAYKNNLELPKTEREGNNSFNATVVCEDKLVTLVDISGECFDMDSGRFERNTANEHFKMIRICKCYVLCLDPKNAIYDGNGLAAQSIGEFIDYLKTRERRYAAPMLLTMTKCDCEENETENHDIDPSEESVASEIKFGNFFEKSGKLIEKEYPQFFDNTSNDAYIACALSSAYGCKPKPDEAKMPSVSKLREVFKGKYIYLTREGRYYVCADPDRRDYSLPKNLAGQTCVVRRDGGAITYVFDPTREDRENGNTRKLTELRLIPDAGSLSSGTGAIFDSSTYLDAPNPLNIGIILEWLLRVCGVKPVRFLEFDEERGRDRAEEYRLKNGDIWSREDSKIMKPELARAVCALFRNPTKLDTWTVDHFSNAGSRVLMGIFDRLGFVHIPHKLLENTKDWREA